MPLSWSKLIEEGFDPKLYREDAPIGTWQATLVQTAYAKSSKVGIHVYVTNESGDKFWFFARWLGGTPVHHFFKEGVNPGDRIEIEVVPSKTGKPFIKSAKRLT